MNTELKEGQKYLTKKGDPVTYLGLTKDGTRIRLRTEVSGNEVTVPKNYKLLPYAEDKINGYAKALMCPTKKTQKQKKPKLSTKIDKYLLDGTHTVKQIAEALKKEPEAKGKNVLANVHARLVAHKRAGNKIEKTPEGQVKVILKDKKA